MSSRSNAERLAHQVSRKTRAIRRRLRAAGVGASDGSGSDPRRLVSSPVFVLSSIRSGSTLLRVILNSHSMICAPHELHLGSLKLTLPPNATTSFDALNMTKRDLENLLWDRMLHLTLTQSGKSIIVDKTPQNTFDWKRIHRSWPDARFLFLLRHPVPVFESVRTAWPKADIEGQYEKVTAYARALDEARAKLPGLTVRYEELTADPSAVARELCSYLGVPWEPGMIDYVSHDHGKFEGRLGDWRDTIKSGVIRPPAPPPKIESIPDELREACELLGYL